MYSNDETLREPDNSNQDGSNDANHPFTTFGQCQDVSIQFDGTDSRPLGGL